MAQAFLFPKTSVEITGTPVHIGMAQSATIQFSPEPNMGFTGAIWIDVAVVFKLTDNWFPIATMIFSPWQPAIYLSFQAHTSNVCFNLRLEKHFQWIRARVTNTKLGLVAGYIAF